MSSFGADRYVVCDDGGVGIPWATEGSHGAVLAVIEDNLEEPVISVVWFPGLLLLTWQWGLIAYSRLLISV
jgi:hypothetical protein